MNYVNLIPNELINNICIYLDYTQATIIEMEFNIDINYGYLLYIKYPAFYKILKILQLKDIKYKEYPYREPYDVINLVEKILKYDNMYISINGLRSENINDFKQTIYDGEYVYKYAKNINMKDIDDILTSYNVLVKQNNIYSKYQRYFPDIEGGENLFFDVAQEFYPEVINIKCLIFEYESDKFKTIPLPLIVLYQIYLYILVKNDIDEEDRKALLSLLRTYNNSPIKNNEKIMLMYIKDFIFNKYK